MFSAHPTTDPGVTSSPKPTKKHTPELTLQISHPKPKKNKQTDQNRFPRGSQNHQKSRKIQPRTPTCPLWCPCGPMDHQHSHPKAKIKPPRYQNGASRSPKFKFWIKQVIHVSSQPVTSYLFIRGAGGRGEALRYSPPPLRVQGVLEFVIEFKGTPAPAAGPYPFRI